MLDIVNRSLYSVNYLDGNKTKPNNDVDNRNVYKSKTNIDVSIILSESATSKFPINKNEFPNLNAPSKVEVADSGSIMVLLLFLLKKLDQDAFKASSVAMVAAKSSVDVKAKAIRDESYWNCGAQVAGAIVQTGVMAISMAKANKSLNKQSAIDRKSKDSKNKALEACNSKNLDNKSKVNDAFQEKSDRFKNKFDEVNSQNQSSIDKLKNDLSKLEANQQDILKANKNIPNRESDHESFNKTKIENKKNELSRLEQDHNDNLTHQKTKFESLEADKNKKIAELDSTHNDDKQIIENEPEPPESKKDYHDQNNSFERYRSLGQLSHAFGATTTSAFSIGTANERAKQANAELDSSVNHKTNDYNRERASSYKSSALEIINQILAILEKHNATIGEIARKC